MTHIVVYLLKTRVQIGMRERTVGTGKNQLELRNFWHLKTNKQAKQNQQQLQQNKIVCDQL